MWFLLAQEHGGEHGGAGGHGGGAEIDPTALADAANLSAALWAWGIFAVLVILLWKFAWGPIVNGLAARERRISESLKKAEEIEKAIRELSETNRSLLEKAQHDAQQIVSEARASAKNAADDILRRASEEVEAQRQRFQRETDLMVDKARDELRRDAVELTLAATARLIGRSLTDADHRRLAEESLREAESVAGG
jgi:F-type H+-transporting ATPase subunit b